MTWRFLGNIRHSLKNAAFCAAIFVVPAPVAAQDIVVTSAQGGLTLSGRFIGYDGTYLQMESKYGPLTLRYGDMTCVGADCPDPETYVPMVRLSGASRMAAVLLPGLIEGFGRSEGYQATYMQIDATHAQLTLSDSEGAAAIFTLRSSTTDEGFADLITHEADIVMSVREVRDSEVMIADEIGIGRLDDGRQSRIIALDALVPVVAPGREIDAISLDDLAGLFGGAITDWAELGAAPGPVDAHLPAAGSGMTQGFVDHVLATERQVLDPDVVFHEQLDDVIRAVVADPFAIAVVPWTEAAFAQQLAVTDQCGLSLIPRPEGMKAEDYPLTMPLFLYLPQRRQDPVVNAFLRWLRTPEAQLVVRRSGFIDAGAVPIALADQGQRFANAIARAGDDVPLAELQRMVAIMKPRTRLSTTFRFEPGSSRLDAQSRSGLLDLADAVRDGRYKGRSLLLIGFSDGRGGAAANKALSLTRADAVRSALVASLGTALPADLVIKTEAFGEALPMGCDDTTWGRTLNRRVELWVD